MVSIDDRSQDGHTEAVLLLLQRGARANIQNEGGATALMRACLKGHIEIVSLLIASGANPNANYR